MARGKRNNLSNYNRVAGKGLKDLEASPAMQKIQRRKLGLKAITNGPKQFEAFRSEYANLDELLDLSKLSADQVANIPWELYEKYAAAKLFSGINFSGTDFSFLENPFTQYSGVKLELINCNLSNTKWPEALDRFDLSWSNLSGADFNSGYISECIFHDSYGDQINFGGVEFSRMNHLQFGKLTNSDFSNLKFGDTTLSFTEEVRDCNFSNAKFYGSRIRNGRFIDCDFSKSSWSNPSIQGALFSNCNFANIAKDAEPKFVETSLSKELPNHGLTDSMIVPY